MPGVLTAGGVRPSRVTVLPPIPSLTIAIFLPSCSESRIDTTSSQRSCASRVEQVPSVMESPNATTAFADVSDSTSIAFSHHIAVVVPVKDVRGSVVTRSPLPSAVRYEVTTAPLCWLGLTSAPGMKNETARSCCARTGKAMGSLQTLPFGGIETLAEPENVTARLEPAATAAP